MDFVITTYAIIGTGELNYRNWGRVVLDESHCIKNGLAKRGPKCAHAAFVIGRRARYKFCISGTPFNNRMKDIAAQAHFIGTAPYDNPAWWKKNTRNTLLTDKWRAKFVLRRTKIGLLQEPEYHEVHVDPTETETELIDILRKNTEKRFKEWQRARSNGDKYRRIQLQGMILALITKLRVYSNSYFSGEDQEMYDSNEVMENNAKVKKIVDDLDIQIANDAKSGVVIFSQFTSFLSVLANTIEDMLPGVDILNYNGSMNEEERDRSVWVFNNSRQPRVILVSLLAGGVGLSLHHGSSTVFISEPYYNPFMEQQAEERVHRLGQESQVNVFRYHMKNTVETWVNKLKDKKLILAGDLELVKPEVKPADFAFEDIAELFTSHVSFIHEDEGKENKASAKKQRKTKNELKI